MNYYVGLVDEKFKRAGIKFHRQILFELYGTFHPIKSHNSSLARLSLENLYHNLFSDLDLEHPDRFYRDFSILSVSHKSWQYKSIGRI